MAEPADGAAVLTWVAPDDTGGSAITSYVLDIVGPEGPRGGGSFGTKTTVEGLENGVTYLIGVAAVNDVGIGTWSEYVTVTPFGLPEEPIGLVGASGNATATLSWVPPAVDGGSAVSGYVVEVSSELGAQEYPTSGTTLSVGSLVNGIRYTLRVAAVNAAGRSSWSNAVTVTPRAPRVTAPQDLSLTQRRLRVRATWSAPVQGEPIAYLVAVSINGRKWRVVTTTTNTAYAFSLSTRSTRVQVRVAALDSYGRGPWSAIAANA